MIYEGFQGALDGGVDRVAAGILVDEQFGGEIAKRATSEHLTLAMPVEKSGQDEFDFEYGDAFAEHIEHFEPTFSKVLVRFNPEGDGALNARQAARLKQLSEWLHHNERKFLFELLVPAEPQQLESVDGDAAKFDTELRPHLMRLAISQLQESGHRARHLEDRGHRPPRGLRGDRRSSAGSAGRDHVACVVLGRGADAAAVDDWLRAASGVPGYRASRSGARSGGTR